MSKWLKEFYTTDIKKKLFICLILGHVFMNGLRYLKAPATVIFIPSLIVYTNLVLLIYNLPDDV